VLRLPLAALHLQQTRPTPPQFAEAATNKIHHWRLVRRWNKCVNHCQSACRGV